MFKILLLPTFNFEVHATKDQRANELGLHLSLEIDKDGGQVVVGVVGDAGGGDGLEELGLRELLGQHTQVLVNEGTQRDAGKEEERERKQHANWLVLHFLLGKCRQGENQTW